MNEFIVCLYILWTLILVVASIWLAYNYLKNEIKDMRITKFVREFLK